MNKTKVLSGIFLFAIIIVIAVFVMPQRFKAEEVTIVASGYCAADDSESVQWSLDSEGTFTISGAGNMKNYVSNDKVPWYNYRNNVKKAIVTDGVTSIGQFTFYNMGNLETVSLTEDITSIGALAFAYTKSLKTVDIPEKVTVIKQCLFQESGIETIDLHSGITKIEYRAFGNTVNLSQISMTNSVTSIGEGVFFGNNKS